VQERKRLAGERQLTLSLKTLELGQTLTGRRGGKKPIAFLGERETDSEAHENHESG
jgi:hypothetical protein